MSNQEEWNKKVEHPLQAYEWGEFREGTGVKVVRAGGIQITIHKVPHTPWSVGYAPKTMTPLNQEMIKILSEVAKKNKCIFIKLEPKVEVQDVRRQTIDISKLGLVPGRALFTKYNFVLDVTPKEDDLLAGFKPKTRYNIRVAEKKGVKVEINDTEQAFKRYLDLTEETTKRQGFYAHGPKYHQDMWRILGKSEILNPKSKLTAQLLVAKYQGEIITTWVVFKFKDTLYYPYGASTREHREVMANNLVMWEAIKLAKQWGCKYLDMWGALGPEADKRDAWYGFHTFKAGYGGRHVEYIGSWDYVVKPWVYKIFRVIEEIRWRVLRLIK